MNNTMGRLATLMALCLTILGDVDAVPLTVETFEAATAGKVVFLKFFAPWCGHCRAMADDWAKLEEEWKDHDVGLVAEVDCTSDDGQQICEDYQIEGFPTIMYGDPLAAESYDGPRDYESMAAFAKEHISKPFCSVFQMDACDEEQTKLLTELQDKSDEELEAMVQKVTDLVKLEEAVFDEEVSKVQQQYDALVTDFNQKLDDIKSRYNYKYVEQVMTARIAENLDAADAVAEEGEEL